MEACAFSPLCVVQQWSPPQQLELELELELEQVLEQVQVQASM